MDAANPLQQLLLRGLGTTTLVAERLRGVSQAWVSSGRLDPNQASALVDDVMKALRGETPELEEQAEPSVSPARRKSMQLRGRIDRTRTAAASTPRTGGQNQRNRTGFRARHHHQHNGLCGLPAPGPGQPDRGPLHRFRIRERSLCRSQARLQKPQKALSFELDPDDPNPTLFAMANDSAPLPTPPPSAAPSMHPTPPSPPVV